MTVEELTNAWAERTYGLKNVESVDFELEPGYDNGCETCGYGAEPPHINVQVRYDGGKFHIFEEAYAPDLIKSILRSAVS